MDTTTREFAPTFQPLIDMTLMFAEEAAPAAMTVTKFTVPKGHDAFKKPRVNNALNVLTAEEGQELTQTQAVSITYSMIDPITRYILVRITQQSEIIAGDDVQAMYGKLLGEAHGVDIDTDITANYTQFMRSIGRQGAGAKVHMDISIPRKARRILKNVSRGAHGGPASDPIYTMLGSVSEEDLLSSLGLDSPVANTSKYVPDGLTEELMMKYGSERMWAGFPTLVDPHLPLDANGDNWCATYSKAALWMVWWKEWTIRTFEAANFLGPTLRSDAFYNSGLAGYPHHGVKFLVNGAES